MKDCPVCHRSGLEDNLSVCPQCNADLECFKLLETLHDKEVPPKAASLKLLLAGGVFVVFAVMSGLVFYHNLVVKGWMDQKPKERGAESMVSPSADGGAVSGEVMARFSDQLTALKRQVEAQSSTADLSSQLTALKRQVEAQSSAADLSGQLTALKRQVEAQSSAADLSGQLTALKRQVEAQSSAADLSGQLMALKRQVEAQSSAADLSGQLTALKRQVEALRSASVPSVSEVQQKQPEVPPTSATSPDRLSPHSPESPPLAEERFFWYTLNQNSTLWAIAKKYYGRGRYYPILMEHNPTLGVMIGSNIDKIRILRQGDAEIARFDRLFLRQGSRTFFRYKVGAGESWGSIARRFYGNEDRAGQLQACNPGIELVVGHRINVLMD